MTMVKFDLKFSREIVKYLLKGVIVSRSIVLAIDTAAEAAAVFRAISSRDGLAAFWTPTVGGSSSIGETLRFGFAEAPVELEMVVTSSEEGSLVDWECRGPWPNWGGTNVSWTLADSVTGSMVVFRHDGWEDGVADAELGSVALTWAMTLQSLRAYVETGVPAPALG